MTARWRNGGCPTRSLVVDELPHGATGKLNKLALRQKYQNYLLEHPVVA